MTVGSIDGLNLSDRVDNGSNKKKRISCDVEGESYLKEVAFGYEVEGVNVATTDGNKNKLRRSSSTSDILVEFEEKSVHTDGSQSLLISEDFYCPDIGSCSVQKNVNDLSGSVIHASGSHYPKLMCRVVGAYFEKIGSKSFAVYSIAVTDAQNNRWSVIRRYRNFERLHRQLKDIPNYNLHLPPKRIFSSSTEDAFVHQRCIQLDRYLQDLLSVANVAEQHEVWDFLSASSKNYSFGMSPSVMKTLAVNVDDAVDDIVQQFKGGFACRVGSSTSTHHEDLTSSRMRNLSLNECDLHSSREASMEKTNNLSENEEGDKDGSCDHESEDSGIKESGWLTDNDLRSKSFPPHLVKKTEDTLYSYSETM